VFFITVAMLFCVSLLVYGLLARLMPQTYSNRRNAALDVQAQVFILELEQVAFSDSGNLFEQFWQNPEIYNVELYDGNGLQVVLPTKKADDRWNGMLALYEGDDFYESSLVLSSDYYFSFSDSSVPYMLIVYGTAEQVDELRRIFQRILPHLLLAIISVSFAVSWLYSLMITKPVLEISQISEEMSKLHLEWQLDGSRTDKLGTLEKSLNLLSHNLSRIV
jgi:two-component system sensor histidine kinase VanS